MKEALVTGSHGLVGSETVKFLCDKGWKVVGIDADIRKYLFGPEASTSSTGDKLKESYPQSYQHINMDLRDAEALKQVMKLTGPFDLIVHAAAQPAHEWSIDHAAEDFAFNATVTVSMLEAYRKINPDCVFIQVSSSKVYGDSVNTLPLEEYETRLDLPKDHPLWVGVGEKDAFGLEMRLDGNLHSLFGASKACGDIMAQEYGKYFNLPIAIFRPVCISGPAHKGDKLHGYLAYLVKCIATGETYIINGYKGKQVRDNIHSYDLVSAFYEVYEDPKGIAGETFNIGGGRESNNSILEAIAQAENILGKKGQIEYSDTSRRGDHRWCIYSSEKFRARYPRWNITYNNDRLMEDLCSIYK